ncbi:MAG: glycosyltransferase family 39 protein [Anaerolineae bacterium]|nr:glycosyltransferase family 39 protein [Anaerolineae bacterium]
MSNIKHQISNAQSAIGPYRERLLLISILAAFLILAIGFSLGPILEGPDEREHYCFVRELAQTRTLPDPRRHQEEFYQPPLYYALAALMTAPIDDADFDQIEVNPYHLYHNHGEEFISGRDNKNHLIHPASEAFPFTQSGTALAVHLVRLLSVACGVGAVLACYAIFRILWPDRAALRLLALAIVAFWPLVLYMSGTISNDALTMLLASLSLLLALRQMRDGPSWREASLLGVVLGAALLTKASLLLLAIPVGLAVLLDLRRSWCYALLTVALALAVGGWWYVRNWVLYGDPTAMQPMYASWPGLKVEPGQLSFVDGLGRLAFVYQRLWARLGANTIVVAPAIYRFFDVLTIAGLSGAAVKLVRRGQHRGDKPWAQPTTRQMTVLAAFGIILLVATVYYTFTNWAGNQGRFLLPGVAIWTALLAAGLDAWTPWSMRLPVALGLMSAMACIAAGCLFGYFLPTYRPLPAPTEIAHPLALRYDDAAELIGIDPELTRARPGDTIRITLVWRAVEPTRTRLLSYLHSTDPEGHLVRRDSLPATGNLLSTEWQSGQTWAEEYVINIPDDAEEQVAYPLIAGLYDPQSERSLPAVDEGGSQVMPAVGRVAISGPPDPFEPDYRFGEIIGLAKPDVDYQDGAIQVCLRWISLAPATVDYHVFIHLLDAGGSQIAQADFQPKDGLYPTSVWVVGEAIEDCVTLDAPGLPQSGWKAAIGLYDLATGLRLPVIDAGGQALLNDMVLISK